MAATGPLAVALSGGGDSLALALIADAWARNAGRSLLILTVDHGVQPESRAWVEACAAHAMRLQRPFRALAWTGDKPRTGLPAAARGARHRLLAHAARDAGARVILMGHTADDLAEAATMRACGSTTPDPHQWAPSPAWPEGRDVFLLRPLLDVRRADLRDWLQKRGETWIDDPANADPHYARSRARLRAATPGARREAPALTLAALAHEALGVIRTSRAALRRAPADDLKRFVALACVCAAGGDRRPATVRIARVADALARADPVVMTLAGARIEAEGDDVRIFREAGELARGGLLAVRPEVGRPAVWDGRFEISGEGGVRRLAGLSRRLPAAQQAALRDLPAAARSGLPALVAADGSVSCPLFTGSAASLVGARLRAAAGLIEREPD